MDPRFLPFQIAAGILLAGLVIRMPRLGMNSYRNNTGLRSWFGAAMFIGGMALGWATMLAGFGHLAIRKELPIAIKRLRRLS